MHSPEDYATAGWKILAAALQLARQGAHAGFPEPLQAWRFCAKHGYSALPMSATKFEAIAWLQPQHHGGTQEFHSREEARKGLALCFCFSDDVAPCEPPGGRRQRGWALGGYVARENRLLVICDVDWLTEWDSAFDYLHEARHLLYYFGSELEGITLNEPAELHEWRCWDYGLRLLDIWGGTPWMAAVEREAAWLDRHLWEAGVTLGAEYLRISGHAHPELETIFGATRRSEARTSRLLLVGVRAATLLAERAGIDRDLVGRNLVRYMERQAQHLKYT